MDKKASHGNHYGREAIGGVIEYAKQLGYHTLLYPVDRRNEASKKIPLYYHGELCDPFTKAMHINNRVIEQEVYEITV